MRFLWIYKIPADFGRSEGGDGSGSLDSVEYQIVYPLGPEEKGRWCLVGTEEVTDMVGTGRTADSVEGPPGGGGWLEELRPLVNC